MAVCLFVHDLNAPPGLKTPVSSRLLHREAPGWGIMHTTGCVGDLSLLLVAERLLMTTEPADDGRARFADAPELLGRLIAHGRVEPFDSAEALQQASSLLSDLVGQSLRDVVPWLKAQQAAAQEWGEQESTAQRLWESDPTRPCWRDLLHEVGLASARHDYRNQNQAVAALLTLLQWQPTTEVDPAMYREAIGRELLYLYASVIAAARGGAVPHDWSDFFPFFARLAEENPVPALSFRLPSLLAQDVDEVASLLGGSEPDRARELLAAALGGGTVSAAEMEQELLRTVPRQLRAPYAYRQVSVYRYSPDIAARIGLGDGAWFAISRWRAVSPAS